jgi:hypothetical protein
VRQHADDQRAAAAVERDVVVRVEVGGVGHRGRERVAVEQPVALRAAHPARQFVRGGESMGGL